MLQALLRFIVILLSFALVGSVASCAYIFTKPRTFDPGSFFMFIIILFSIIGSSVGVYDYVTLVRLERTIPSSGLVLGGTADFGCYWDVTATREVTEVEWGTMEPGQNGTVTFYVKNEATQSIYCAISWIEGSWQPEDASQYFTLIWDFGENPLGVNRARKVVLYLQVSPDIHDVTDFSFNILLVGQDEPFTG